MDVNYRRVKHYDTAKKPLSQAKLFTWILWAGSKLMMASQPYTIEKINMEGFERPYLLLSNHHYFVDFYLNALATYPNPVNNVATIDGYYRRPFIMEWLGCICKRKFTTDLNLIRSIRYCFNELKSVVSLYPEARYTPIGTTAILPDALGKMVKLCGVPVAVLIHHGNYLHTPFWDHDHPRKVKLHSTLTGLLTAEEVKKLSPEEINEKIREAFRYDEYEWQKKNRICITEPFRAQGLHKVLYQCPHCGTESRMNSKGSELFCEACGKRWEMDELGELHALEGETEFTHIPDWFEWERSQVRRQVRDGSYRFEDEVDVYSLPGTWRFEKLGKAVLTHDMTGFTLKGRYNGEDYCIHRPAQGMYGLHVEYDYVYIKPFDCVDISTENDSFYCYPARQNVVTKLSFATEELFILYRERLQEEKLRKRRQPAEAKA